MKITRNLLSAMEKSTGFPSKAYAVTDEYPFGVANIKLCLEVEAFGRTWLSEREAFNHVPAPILAVEVVRAMTSLLQREAFARESI